MSALSAAILAIVTQLKAAPQASPSPSFIPSPQVPAGLTLRNTYTASASGLSYPSAPNGWVYVVAAGGGGGGGGGTGGGGGGGGACVQGWVKAADLTAVTIGAGGSGAANASGGSGGATIAGPVRAAGGGGGTSGTTPAVNSINAGLGAGFGGWQASSTYNSYYPDGGGPASIAYGLFSGGRPLGQTSTQPPTHTSGAGAYGAVPGADGHQGPGGGGGGPTPGSTGGDGGDSLSPNGTTYVGGTPGVGVGGGGAGILANGGNANSSISGGAGGSGGGGGGGAGNTAYPPGVGGNGAVLVYY